MCRTTKDDMKWKQTNVTHLQCFQPAGPEASAGDNGKR